MNERPAHLKPRIYDDIYDPLYELFRLAEAVIEEARGFQEMRWDLKKAIRKYDDRKERLKSQVLEKDLRGGFTIQDESAPPAEERPATQPNVPHQNGGLDGRESQNMKEEK